MLQTTQQLGSAVGVAVIVSVYAAGAVPGEPLPGLRAAFLTSAAFSATALVLAVTLLLRQRLVAVPGTVAVEDELAPAGLVEAA